MALCKRASRTKPSTRATIARKIIKPSSSRNKAKTPVKRSTQAKRSSRAIHSTQAKSSTPPNFLMQCPREIRDKIYDYAFIAERQAGGQSQASNSVESTAIQDFHPYGFYLPSAYNIERERHCSSRCHCPLLPFWGQEPMTRLLRVSRPIYNEASEVLYSRLKLCWGTDTTKEKVQRILKHRISVRVRDFITSVQIRLSMRTMRHGHDQHLDDTKIPPKHAVAWLVHLMPRLTKVDLKLGFWFLKGQRIGVEQTVELALDVLSPLQELKLNALRVGGYEGDDFGRNRLQGYETWDKEFDGRMVKEFQARIQSGV